MTERADAIVVGAGPSCRAGVADYASAEKIAERVDANLVDGAVNGGTAQLHDWPPHCTADLWAPDNRRDGQSMRLDASYAFRISRGEGTPPMRIIATASTR